MAITIDPQHCFEDVWVFFRQWLTLLKGPEPDAPFRLLDGCSGDQFDAITSEEFLGEFSGDPNERLSYQYIDLDGELELDCKSDSSVSPIKDGEFWALLYIHYVVERICLCPTSVSFRNQGISSRCFYTSTTMC